MEEQINCILIYIVLRAPGFQIFWSVGPLFFFKFANSKVFKVQFFRIVYWGSMIYALYAKLWILVIGHLFYWHTGVQLYNFWHKKRQVRIERSNLQKKVQSLSFVLPKIKSNGFCSKKLILWWRKYFLNHRFPFA